MLTTTRTGAGSTLPSRPSLAGTVPLPATSTSTTTSWGTTSWRPTGRPRPSSRPPQQTSRTAGRRRPATRATPACAQCRRRRLAASRRPARHHRRRPLPARPCLPWLHPDVSVFISGQTAAGDACFNMLQPASALEIAPFYVTAPPAQAHRPPTGHTSATPAMPTATSSSGH